MRHRKEEKIVELVKSNTGLRLSRKLLSSDQKYNFKKFIFEYDAIVMSQTRFMTLTPRS